MTVLTPPIQLDDDEELPQKAAVSLNFLVIGAGLGGLVAAITLKHAGHSVIVLDARTKEQVLSESNGESFYVGPNIHRVLNKCGVVLPEQEAWQARLSSMRRYANGELLLNIRTETELHDECGGGEFYVANSTLVKLLYDKAIEEGADVRFGTKVVDVSSVDTLITLESGKKLNADVIVGADGPFSVVRKTILGEDSPNATEELDCSGEFISFRVDKKSVLGQPNLKDLFEKDLQFWMGPGAWVCSYPLRGGEEYCIVAFSVCPYPDRCPLRRRSEIAVTDDIRNRYSHFDPIVHDLFQLPKTVTSTHWRMAKQLESWVRDDGKVVLIGDAAHSTQPTSIASSPSLNLEDGAVLGALYTYIRDSSQIPLLSQTYEDLRTERCKNTLKLDMAFLELCSLPDGPEQQARDRMFAEKGTSNGEEMLMFDTMWNQRIEIWRYDAWEDVEDWWLKLGRISRGMTDGHEPHVAVRRLSVGVEKQIQIASESRRHDKE